MDRDKNNEENRSVTPAPEPSTEQPESPPTKPPRWKKALRIAAISLGVLLLLLLLALLTWKWWAKPVLQPIWEDNVQMEVEPEANEVEVTPDLPPVQEVKNIALFGIDQIDGSSGRSDALVILSIDKTNKKIKLVSLDRDSLVAIDGHGEEKITHAWAYGQGKLAVKTINQNFGMNITDYAYINFREFVNAVDYLGGVTLDVTAQERDEMNRSYNAWYQYYGYYIPKVQETGKVNLMGGQALSYARDRSDGTGNRASRHREVLSALLDRVKEQPVTQWYATFCRMLQLCHTTLSFDEAWELALWVLEESPTIEELSLPNAELEIWSGILDDERGWVRTYDLEAATAVLHRFIYETDEVLPPSEEMSTTAPTVADAPKTEKTKKTSKAAAE